MVVLTMQAVGACALVTVVVKSERIGVESEWLVYWRLHHLKSTEAIERISPGREFAYWVTVKLWREVAGRL